MEEKLTVDRLLKLHQDRKKSIQSRLSEFKTIRNDKQIFRELCFCILTANGTARIGINCIEALGDKIFTGTEKEIYNILNGRCRWTNRADYIVRTRNYLKKDCNMELSKKINSFKDKNELRDYFAKNKNIVGLGYKESSHFLRNIGISGYAILDKHIINCLHELKIFKTPERSKSGKHYLEMENQLREFSKQVGINIDELDLVLWSYKTGEILK